MIDIRDSDPGFNENQHCTYPDQNGRDDYSFSHTAKYCGKPQPRRCGCAFDYAESDDPVVTEGCVVETADGKLFVYLPNVDELEPFFQVGPGQGRDLPDHSYSIKID